MNLEETIERFKEQAATLRMAGDYGCHECAAEYEQVAEWLTELKQRREAEITAPPKTNGDKIRAMTDEELAEFIDTVTDCCSDGWMCDKCPIKSTGCDKDSFIEWLKQEVSEDEAD